MDLPFGLGENGKCVPSLVIYNIGLRFLLYQYNTNWKQRGKLIHGSRLKGTCLIYKITELNNDFINPNLVGNHNNVSVALT